MDQIEYPKCSVLTFACDNDRYVDVWGKKYSPLINTVEDALNSRGVSCTSISRIASTIKGDLSHGRVFSPEGGFARAMISKRVKQKLQFKDSYPFSYSEKRIWDQILDQTTPKAVVAILPSRELCAACKERGIWVADLQHGVIADAHPWYGEDFRASDPEAWIPNAFLVWDEGSADVVNKWAPRSGATIELIGNPWVDRFRRRADDDVIYQELLSQYPMRNNGKPNALVSLSWDSYNIDNGFIHPALEAYILETIDIYNWSFRLHPNQLQGFATDEGDEFVKYFNATYPLGSIDWQTASMMPLPLLLSRTNYHVTWCSSVCMEAAYFGISSLLMDPELLTGNSREDYYNFLCAAGFATKINPTYLGVKNWFESQKKSNLAKPPIHDRNFINLIDRITLMTEKKL